MLKQLNRAGKPLLRARRLKNGRILQLALVCVPILVVAVPKHGALTLLRVPRRRGAGGHDAPRPRPGQRAGPRPRGTRARGDAT